MGIVVNKQVTLVLGEARDAELEDGFLSEGNASSRLASLHFTVKFNCG